MNSCKLKGKRVESGYTQQELAEKIGISAISYTRKENGIRDFSCREAAGIAKELGLSNKDIVKIFFSL